MATKAITTFLLKNVPLTSRRPAVCEIIIILVETQLCKCWISLFLHAHLKTATSDRTRQVTNVFIKFLRRDY